MTPRVLHKNNPRERRETFFDFLEKSTKKGKNVKAVVISDQKHIFYFTGFSTWRPRHSSFLVLHKSEEPVLFLGSSGSGKAEQTFDGKVVTFEDYNVQERMVAYGNYVSRKFYEFVRELKMLHGQSVLGVESWNLPCEYANALRKAISARFLDISETILQMRKTKGKDELTFEREASRRLSLAYKRIKENSLAGETELGLFAEANASNFRKFDPLEYFEVSNIFGDYVSGRRTAEGSGGPTKRKLKRNDLLILDLQASYKRHWVDACRTYLVGSKSTQRLELVFGVIMKAKEKSEELLRPGTKGSEIFRAVSDTIVEAGFRPLHHHAGHGLGLDDQEPPFFLPNSEETLEEGVVCAIEPGIYDRSFGGMRVEDNYIITKDGFENISKFSLGFP
jgi:Xaa-Pro aminopeptidase